MLRRESRSTNCKAQKAMAMSCRFQDIYDERKASQSGVTRHAMDEAVTHARSLAQSAGKSSDPITKFLADCLTGSPALSCIHDG
jgi:hypothetical protein